MAGKFREVPVEEILNMLPKRRFKRERLNIPKAITGDQEKAQYGPLVDGLQSFLAPGWELVNTSVNADHKIEKIYQQTAVKPDLSLYAETGFTACNMKKLELFGEVKPGSASPPFDSRDSHKFETQTDDAKDTRGQVTLYHTAVQVMQPRTRVFSFYVQSTSARLLCHSRAGTEVSHAFDINGPENYLGEFLWRFSHAPKSNRGHDTSVQPVKRKTAAATARKALGLEEEADLFQVIVDTEKFIFAQPFTSSHRWPVGRGTRCYHAYWVEEKKVVLLKDTWRKEEYGKEGDVYEILRLKQVRNIATVICHGDVDDQNRFQFAEGEGGRKLRHYRIVLEEVGEPLNRFKSTWELVKVMSDAFTAHRDAFEKAEILHRDVSFGNILLIRSGDEARGLLIDWEFSKVKDRVDARAPERTGTFQFLSLRLLKDHRSTHLASDDIQSFLHVLVWAILRHVPTALTKGERASRLKSFDPKDTLMDTYTAKFDTFRGDLSRTLRVTTAPFRELLFALLSTLSHAINHEHFLNDNHMPERQEERDAWEMMTTHDFVANAMEESLRNLEWKEMEDSAVKYVDD
ncbi:hypothetical protein BT69DRAFT_1251802 [Atractiella rhizophila]|nr:hypothetical protein BT69DRAFT_1251802 [Atractiella rhizophila]